MSRRRFALTLLPLLLSLAAQVQAKDQANDQAASSSAAVSGDWRFTHATAAPWGAPLTGSAQLTGKTLHLAPRAMTGPAPLDCGTARLEDTSYPAEGLFQGNLPAPAESAAQALGIMKFPVAGLQVTCSKGIFDFHRADADTLLLALDNRIWTLSRATGAQGKAASPEGVVERLLEQHFNGDMGFTPETLKSKTGWLSDRLQHRIARYFAKPASADEVPAIDGDPFTYSQEYPLRFAVGKAKMVRGAAQVPVRFADGVRDRVVTYILTRDGAAWKVDDLHYEDGADLARLLK